MFLKKYTISFCFLYSTLSPAMEESPTATPSVSSSWVETNCFLSQPQEVEWYKDVDILKIAYQEILKDPKIDKLTRYGLGSVLLRKIGVNGFDASVIILDIGFFLNASVKYSSPLFAYHRINEYPAAAKSLSKTTHGTFVSSAAASIYANDMAIAYGAHILPTTIYEHSLKHLDSNLTSREELEHYAWMRSFNFGLGNTGQFTTEALNSLQLFETTISSFMNAVKWEKNKEFQLPRVLSTSLNFKVSTSYMEQLGNFLEENDMLFITAAGNDSIEMENVSTQNVESEERMWIDSLISKYPQVLARTIFVGSHDADKEVSDYSNKANTSIVNDFLYCDGDVECFLFDTHFNSVTISEDEQNVRGTSFAAPRVASMAVILGKYFPKLTMRDIKNILLESAHEISSETHGSYKIIDPCQAWIYAIVKSNKISHT